MTNNHRVIVKEGNNEKKETKRTREKTHSPRPASKGNNFLSKLKNRHKKKVEEKNPEITIPSSIVINHFPSEKDTPTQDHLTKLAEINTAILDKDVPLTVEQQGLLSDHVKDIEKKLELPHDSNEIRQDVKALNQQVLDCRYQYVEEQKTKIVLETQRILESEITNLQQKAQYLEEHPVTFEMKTPKNKPSFFSSFFKCLPCCNSEEQEPEKRALLKR